ncbi:PAS domain-containing protein [Comamonas terrigena]|uniref:PAS domain-containing protein n=1 Tax=Comamonas terrigena TaxID=32013 RepID=UPI003D14E755
MSGFTMDELMGQPHNMVRHPHMPPEAFKDMWSTIGNGRNWSGLVKNRRKNGDFYWVRAHVTPIVVNGKPRGYMSVRTKPSREEVHAAQALYARIQAEREAGIKTFVLHAGQVRPTGWRDYVGRLQRASFTQRLRPCCCSRWWRPCCRASWAGRLRGSRDCSWRWWPCCRRPCCFAFTGGSRPPCRKPMTWRAILQAATWPTICRRSAVATPWPC